MSDIIYYKNGEETFRISPPTPPTLGTKCPETKLEIKMTEPITLNLTLDELKLIDKHLWISVATKPILEKIKNAYPKPDVIEVDGVKYQRIEEPTKPMDEVIDRLESKYEKKVEEETFPDEWYNDVEWNEDNTPVITDEVVNKMLKKWEENPPEFLKFELGKTLEDLITRWWCDVFTTHDDWDMETAIDDLVDQIQLWLPKPQNASGSQSLGVEDMVEGFNDCLEKIKSKLRNKKI